MTPPPAVKRDQPVVAEGRGAPLVVDPEPVPSDVSPRRLRRGLVRLGGLLAIAVVVVTLAPGLGELRKPVQPMPSRPGSGSPARSRCSRCWPTFRLSGPCSARG